MVFQNVNKLGMKRICFHHFYVGIHTGCYNMGESDIVVEMTDLNFQLLLDTPSNKATATSTSTSQLPQILQGSGASTLQPPSNQSYCNNFDNFVQSKRPRLEFKHCLDIQSEEGPVV